MSVRAARAGRRHAACRSRAAGWARTRRSAGLGAAPAPGPGLGNWGPRGTSTACERGSRGRGGKADGRERKGRTERGSWPPSRFSCVCTESDLTADAARGMARRDRFGSASALPRRGLGAAAGSYDRPAGHRPHTGLRSPSLPHPRCLSQGDSELFPSGVGVDLRIPRTQTGLRRDLADEPGRSV